MKCPRCEHENPQGARFCEECATPLARMCSNCGTTLSATAKFCHACAQPVAITADPSQRSPDSYTPKHLAEKILISRAALEGERKQVTVLFADLKGSMELLADRDPEEARKLLDPVLELMMDAAHRYEGTVNQVMGDGIMALFGAPLAHEDHAVRACYAALHMQESVKRYAEDIFRSHGVPIEIRVGLNSGDVVVRAIASDLHMDYTAVGQTTHLAARMEQMARPGTVLLTPETLALVEGLVQVSSRGRVPVKGVGEPIEIFELIRANPVRGRLQAEAARGLTPFVGRDSELELLRQALGRAAEGKGQIVAIVGEPGVGKSRLVWEFTHSHRSYDWLVLEATCVSYGKAATYYPIIELLRRYFQIDARDDRRSVVEKVTGKLLSLDRALDSTLGIFLSLLGVAVDDTESANVEPRQHRRRTLDALKRLLLRESQIQPLLLVFEDLHWIDSETQALLDELVQTVPTTRVLLLVNYRVEYQHSWGSHHDYAQIGLDALAPDNAEQLLDAILGPDCEFEALKRVLITRTDGNPFFLEESVRTLVDTRALIGERGAYRLSTPLPAIQVPTTVHSVLAARIDRLRPEDKIVLQMASAIGKDIPYALLEAIAEQPEDALHAAVDRLQAAELIYPTALFPDVQYSFKHSLTHEVAYRTLVLPRRRKLHAAILRASEEMLGDGRAEEAALLAQHAVRGEVWDRAFVYLRLAGSQAFSRSAHRLAASWFEQALDVLARLPSNQQQSEDAIDVRLDLRYALSPLGEHQRLLACLREAEEIAEQLADGRRLARIASYLANYYQVMGQYEESVRYSERALDIATSKDDLATQIVARSYLSLALQTRGEYQRAIMFARANLIVLGEAREQQWFGMALLPSVYTGTSLARSLAEVGEFDEAIAVAQRGIGFAEAVNHSYSLMFALLGLGLVELRRGRADSSLAPLEHSLQLCLATESPSMAALVGSFLGSAYVHAGRPTEAMKILREAAERAKAVGLGNETLPRGVGLMSLAEAHVASGRVAQAIEAGRLAADIFTQMKARGYTAWAIHLLAKIAAQAESKASDAASLYQQALSIAIELGMRPLEGHCYLGLADLHARLGDPEQAAKMVGRAQAQFAALRMRSMVEVAQRVIVQ